MSTRVDSSCNKDNAAIGLTTEDGGAAGNIVFNNLFLANDFLDPPGYLWAKSLDAGTYKLGYGGVGNFTTKNPLGNAFTVTAGKAIYLGELKMGSQGCFSLTLSATDQWARDANLLRQKVQGVDPKDVEISILKFGR